MVSGEKIILLVFVPSPQRAQEPQFWFDLMAVGNVKCFAGLDSYSMICIKQSSFDINKLILNHLNNEKVLIHLKKPDYILC